MMKLRHLFSFLVIMVTIVQGYAASPPEQHTIPETIQVAMYALNDDGSKKKGSPVCTDASQEFAYGCGYKHPNDPTKDDPFTDSSHIISVNLENEYLPAVLVQELGNTTKEQYEALKAQAITSRSFALHFADVQRSELSNSTSHQVFAPKTDIPDPDNPDEIQAVNDTTGQLLLCGDPPYCLAGRQNTPIFAEFGPDHGCRGENCPDGDTRSVPNDWTLGSTQAQHPYNVSLWDPIRNVVNAGGNGHGMDHEAAKSWATGHRNNNNYHPSWDYRRILAHYYTGIRFQDVSPQPPDYRFNIVQFSDFGSQDVEFSADNKSKIVRLFLQNTGAKPWNLGEVGDLDCIHGTHNIALSYHIYTIRVNQNGQEVADKLACSGGDNLCFEGTRTMLCDNRYGSQIEPGQRFEVNNAKIDLPINEGLPDEDACYILRWDIELSRNHDRAPIWISRPDTSAYDWPTQDIKICYDAEDGGNGGDDTDPPTIEDESSSSGWYRPDNEIVLVWTHPSPTIKYDWKYTGSGGMVWENDKWVSLPEHPRELLAANHTSAKLMFPQEGEHEICIYAVSTNGDESNGSCLVYQIDNTAPTINWSELPELIDEPYQLNWSITEEGSGVDQVILEYKKNNGSFVEAIRRDEYFSKHRFEFQDGTQGDQYQFRLQVCDKVDNCSDWVYSKVVTYKPNPELSLSQPQIVWLTTLEAYPTIEMRPIGIQNHGGSTLNWTAHKDYGNYLALREPTSGQVSNCEGQLTLELLHPGSLGDYPGQIAINSDTGEPQIVPITIKVVPQIFYTYLPIIYGGQPQNDLPPCQAVTNESLQTELLMDCTLSSDNWCRTPITFTFVVTSERPVASWYRFTEISTQTTRTRQTVEWLQYSEPFTYDIEGNQTIHYYSEDDVGNVEPVQTDTFRIDLTTPIVEINAERLSRCDTELGYTIRDLVSGLRDVEVVVDGEPVDEDFNLMYLELGDHTIAITGTDYADWVTTFVKHIPLPADVAGIICTKHILYDLGEIYGPGALGIVNSLDAKLEAAQRAIERDQIHTAINQLNAFINEVNAQQESHIKLAGAERMIADAVAIIAILQAQ